MKRLPRPLTPIRWLLSLLIWVDVAVIIFVLLQLDGPGTRRFDVLPSVVLGPQPRTLDRNPELSLQTAGVTITDPSGWQTLLDLFAGPLTFALATLPMIGYALRLLDRAVATQPFTPQTASGLRRLGIVVLVAGAAAELVRSVAAYLLQASVVPAADRAVTLDSAVGFWWLLVGLLLLGFAQIIAHGTALRTELDEVI